MYTHVSVPSLCQVKAINYDEGASRDGCLHVAACMDSIRREEGRQRLDCEGDGCACACLVVHWCLSVWQSGREAGRSASLRGSMESFDIQAFAQEEALLEAFCLACQPFCSDRGRVLQKQAAYSDACDCFQ